MDREAKRFILIGFVFVAALVYRVQKTPRFFPHPVALEALDIESGDPCEERQECIVMYLAPWCPSCRTMLNPINALRTRLAESKVAGLKVIIGAATENEIRAFANDIGAPVYLDLSGDLQRRLAVDRYPSTYVVSVQDGRIIEFGDSAVNWVNQTFKQEFSGKVSKGRPGEAASENDATVEDPRANLPLGLQESPSGSSSSQAEQ